MQRLVRDGRHIDLPSSTGSTPLHLWSGHVGDLSCDTISLLFIRIVRPAYRHLSLHTRRICVAYAAGTASLRQQGP